VRQTERIPNLELGPSPRALILAAAGLFLSDWGTQHADGSTFPGAPLDETAHLLTTLLVLWALGPKVSRRFMGPALLASVAIDADHIPDRLGFDWLTVGTPRPYTHSLSTIVVVLLGALAWSRKRRPLFALAIGLTIHFWRDMAEQRTGMSLLWPVSYRVFSYARGSYLAAMSALIGVDAYRCFARGPLQGEPAAVQPMGQDWTMESGV
jgi:inner membrane protein